MGPSHNINISAVFGHFAVLCASLIFFSDAAATPYEDASEWSFLENVSVRLIAADPAHENSDYLLLGVEMRLFEGWKTYWRQPGPNGLAARFDWSQSENLDVLDVLWPAPSRLEGFDSDTLGYQGQVVLPIQVAVPDAGAAAKVDLKLEFGICDTICIPLSTRLTFTIPPEGVGTSPHHRVLHRFLNRVPHEAAESEIAVDQPTLRFDSLYRGLEVVAHRADGFEWPDIALSGLDGARPGVPSMRLSDDKQDVHFFIPLFTDLEPETLAGRSAEITLWDKDGRGIRLPFTVPDVAMDEGVEFFN